MSSHPKAPISRILITVVLLSYITRPVAGRASLARTVMRVLMKTVVMMMMTDYDGRDRGCMMLYLVTCEEHFVHQLLVQQGLGTHQRNPRQVAGTTEPNTTSIVWNDTECLLQ